MRLVVNDREVDFPAPTGAAAPATGSGGPTVAALMAGLGYPDHGVAVAVDAAVVPRSQWTTAVLQPGMRVDVVTAVQGG